jgi:membrane-bound serine protease (ClpP class)
VRIAFTLIVLSAQIALLGPARRAHASVVARATIEDQAITEVTTRYLERAIQRADALHARYLVIELDTPGGEVAATRQIVRDILGSKTEIVVYVAPSGAHAASAGLFLALASDVAVMAPGTNIGAAHPVMIPGLPGRPADQKGPDVLGEKVVNDTRAWARSLAEYRGRNVEIAEMAVTESRSFSATEAASSGLVDFVAADVEELLQRLQVPGATIQSIEQSWSERLLAALAVPNLAFILLLIGVYALVFEFHAGGHGVAAVIGVFCIVLAFFGLSVLPLNYAGLGLVVVGIALLIAEAFVTSFGLLTLGGVASLIIGGLMLVDAPPGFERVSATVVIPAALASTALSLFVLGKAIKASREPVRTGSEALRGERAIAVDAFGPVDGHYAGTVRVHGELWNATANAPLDAGAPVTITSRDGLSLTVIPDHGEKGQHR